MVVACPGAGKTRAIVARYLNRASALQRKGVALLSFTNAAVDEVGRRCISSPELLSHPHYVGTFDSFIHRFIFSPRFSTESSMAATLLENWDVQDVTAIVPDRQRPHEKFSLEHFDFDQNGVATLEPNRISQRHRRRLVEIYRGRSEFLNRKASETRASRLRRGYVSCSEARRQVHYWLQDAKRRSEIAAILSARFAEVIVDEVQDCGREELELLRVLRDVGVVVSIVGDPDQAIFEFRNAVPDRIFDFGKELESHISFSDNYRSSPAICKVNSVLRLAGEPDVPRGDLASCRVPVHVIAYTSSSQIALMFQKILEMEQLSTANSIIISHSNSDAKRAASARDNAEMVNVFAIVAARAGLVLRDPSSSPKLRRQAVDRFLRRLIALYSDLRVDSFEEAAVDLGTTMPELKGAAVRLALSLDARTLSRDKFAALLRERIETLQWPKQPTLGNIAQIVKKSSESDWSKLGLGEPDARFQFGTIHSVKGLEFESVCLVIPKDRSTAEESGLRAWLEGKSAESRRVLYVGASRARRLLALAVHQTNVTDVRQKLDDAGIPMAGPL